MSITQVNVELEEDLKRKIEALKKYYGIQNNAELIRVLVNEKAQLLKKNGGCSKCHPMILRLIL